VGQKKEVEIMLVLDRSGSMAGTPIASLKTAATNFVNMFSDTQDKDKMGLVSFATSVTMARALGTNYVAPMTGAISGMSAVGATNTEDAIDLVDGPQGFTDQTGVPGDLRIQQFMILFSDGRPTAFRGGFLKSGTIYDAVACVTGNCVSGDGGGTYGDIGKPLVEQWFGVSPMPTGPGTNSVRCPGSNQTLATMRWYIFDTDSVPGYRATATCIPDPALHDQVCNLATNLAVAHANELKAKYIKIYTIGLGSNVNTTLMRNLATDQSMYYYAPTSADLTALFQKVAQEIKLRLVY
jgi:hypothetical protein